MEITHTLARSFESRLVIVGKYFTDLKSAIGANSASKITPESRVIAMSHQLSAQLHYFENPEENESSDGLRLRTKS